MRTKRYVLRHGCLSQGEPRERVAHPSSEGRVELDPAALDQ
jgi:hypothetical protein